MSAGAREVSPHKSYALPAVVLPFVTAAIEKEREEKNKKRCVRQTVEERIYVPPLNIFDDSHSFVVVLA